MFKCLFYFACFYLEQYPTKVVSFFDYMLYLMEQATILSVPELVDLDHKMRMDFYVHHDSRDCCCSKKATRGHSTPTSTNLAAVLTTKAGCKPPSWPLNQSLGVQFQARLQRKHQSKKSWRTWSKMKFVYLGTVVNAEFPHQKNVGGDTCALTHPVVVIIRLLIVPSPRSNFTTDLTRETTRLRQFPAFANSFRLSLACWLS